MNHASNSKRTLNKERFYTLTYFHWHTTILLHQYDFLYSELGLIYISSPINWTVLLCNAPPEVYSILYNTPPIASSACVADKFAVPS